MFSGEKKPKIFAWVRDICEFFIFIFHNWEQPTHTDAATSWLIVCMWLFEIQIAAGHNISLLDRWKKINVEKGVETNMWHFPSSCKYIFIN